MAGLVVGDLDMMEDRSEVAERIRGQSEALGEALEEMKREVGGGGVEGCRCWGAEVECEGSAFG